MIKVIETEEEWDSILLKFNTGDLFFTYKYFISSLKKEGKEEAVAFHFKSDNCEVFYPVIKRKIFDYSLNIYSEYVDISSPFGYSGVLCDGDFNVFEKEWIKYVKENNIVSEFIRLSPFHSQNIPTESGIKISDFVTINYSDFDDLESVFRSMRKGHKSDVNYAKKQYQVTSIHFDEFCNSFKKFCEQKHLQRQFNSFLQLVENKFILENSVFLGVKNKNGELLSSAFFLLGTKIAHYFFAAINSYERGVPALIIWEGIKLAKEKKVQIFSLGGGASIDDSIFKFKKGFSKKSSAYIILKKIHNTEQYNTFTESFLKKNNAHNLFPSYRKSN